MADGAGFRGERIGFRPLRLQQGVYLPGDLPIVQYELFDTAELTFSPRVRLVCETDCAHPQPLGGVQDQDAVALQTGKHPLRMPAGAVAPK